MTKTIIILAVCGLAASTSAYADTVPQTELTCLAEAIYFEGRSETLSGMYAIGNVILNRVDNPKFPNTICGVVHQGPMDGSKITLNRCQFSYFCDGISDAFPVSDNMIEINAAEWSTLVAEDLVFGDRPDRTKGSTYYHANYVSPFWTDSYELVAAIGTHLFYMQ